MEKLVAPSGTSLTPQEAKFWRSVSQRALTPEVVMNLHLPNFAKIFSDIISKCGSFRCHSFQATGPVDLAYISN